MSGDVSDELISAYLDGELTPDEQALVERALTVDPERRRTYRELLALRDSLQSLPVRQLGDDLSSQVLRRAGSSRPSSTSPEPAAPDAADPLRFPPLAGRPTSAGAWRQAAASRWTKGLQVAWISAAAAAAAMLLLALLPGRAPLAPSDAVSLRQQDAASGQSAARPLADSLPLSTVPRASDAAAAKAPRVEAPEGRGADARHAIQLPENSLIADDLSPNRSLGPTPRAPSTSSEAHDEGLAAESNSAPAARPEKAAPRPDPIAAMRPAPRGGMEINAHVQPRIATIEHAGSKGAFARSAPLPGGLMVLLDSNLDGSVSDQEALQTAIRLQEHARATSRSRAAQAILEALDADHNGQLDRDETLRGVAAARMGVEGPGRALASLLNALDADADGLVTALEFDNLIGKLGRIGALVEPRLAQLFASLDANHDRTISVVESQMVAEAFVRQSGMEIQTLGLGGRPQPDQSAWTQVRVTMLRLDRDRDGRLSRREARKDPLLRRAFDDVNRDGDKDLTAGELYDYLAAQFPAASPSAVRLRITLPRPTPSLKR